MGLFSSETVHHVGTSISRLIDDTKLYSTVEAATTLAIHGENRDLVDEILEASIESIAVKHSRVYNYGKNTFLYGLPSGELYSNNQGGPEVQAVIDGLTGGLGLVEYRRFGPANAIHMAWMRLVTQYNYNTETNELVGLSNAAQKMKAYLVDMVYEVPSNWAITHESSQLQIWGIPANSGYLPSRPLSMGALSEVYYQPTPYTVNGSIATPRLRLVYEEQTTQRYYSFSDTENPVVQRTVYLNLNVPDPTVDYFQVMYTVNGKPHYWMYEYGSGLQPTLDAVYTSTPSVVGDFYPNLYFRLNKTNLAQNTGSTVYLHNKKLAKLMNLDYDQLSTAVHENSGIGDVEQAFVTFAVPADTTIPVELRYLYEFWDRAYAADNPQNNGVFAASRGFLTSFSLRQVESNGTTSQSFIIRDGAFKMSLTNRGILKYRKAGNLGPVGTVTKANGNHSYQTYTSTWSGDDSSSKQLVTVQVPYRAYRKQISATHYDEIQVLGLVMRYEVYGFYQTTLGDNGGEILLVPIDRQIIKEFGFKDRELLLSRSLHFVFNSHQVQVLKWYEQGWFSDLIQIVGIVLTVFSLGSTGGFFAGLAAAATTQAAILLIAQQILIMVAMKLAFKLFVKVVGIDLAFLAALVAAAYGMWDQIKSGANQLTVTAKEFLTLANGLIAATGNELKLAFDALGDESKAFDALKKEQQKLLDDANALLEPKATLAPLIVYGESPTEYFRRTIHSGNIGTLLLDDTHYFVDRSLKLPTLSQTLGAFNVSA